MTNIIKREIESWRNNKWQQKLESISADLNATHKIIKAMKNKPQRSLPPLSGQNGVVYTTEEKADVLADSLELQFSENQTDSDHEDLEEEAQETYNQIRQTPPQPPTFPITAKKIKIKNLP